MKVTCLIVSIIFFTISTSYAENRTLCLKGRVVAINDSFSNNRVDITKQFRVRSGDIACFGNLIEIKILDVLRESLTVSINYRGKSRRVILPYTGSKRIGDFVIRRIHPYLSDKPNFQIKLSTIAISIFQNYVEPPTDFPGALCVDFFQPVCLFDGGKLITSGGFCSDEISRNLREVYQGAC